MSEPNTPFREGWEKARVCPECKLVIWAGNSHVCYRKADRNLEAKYYSHLYCLGNPKHQKGENSWEE